VGTGIAWSYRISQAEHPAGIFTMLFPEKTAKGLQDPLLSMP